MKPPIKIIKWAMISPVTFIKWMMKPPIKIIKYTMIPPAKIIKWLMILSPYLIPLIFYLVAGPNFAYWTGVIGGACWMFITLTVGDIFRKARQKKEPRI